MGTVDVARDAYREALPALAASLVGGLLAGVVLGGMRAELRAVEGLLVLVPALLATRGNVYGSFGARLSTGLHQGLVEPRVDAGDERLRAAASAALANGLLASALAAVGAAVLLRLLGRPVAPLATLLSVALVAGLLSGVALTVVVVVVVFAGYRRGRNPDTLVGPVVTTTGDVFGVVFLLLAVRATLALVGLVGGAG
ncbi:magnesium transporter [Candidatus Halobonum tyrrellensis]|uniref:Mg2+ transporter n=1 Tax=Candidatus Halobonum tyrrellensis G22 TaxID=1324957 RepID=V4HJ89_9EURY|nr:magnesium transporter [Candidatus Halobonum tyrrellensis]ESP87989.1 Mg2+ transporter [Candidatus Halobonum tyrrellensis G22]